MCKYSPSNANVCPFMSYYVILYIIYSNCPDFVIFDVNVYCVNPCTQILSMPTKFVALNHMQAIFLQSILLCYNILHLLVAASLTLHEQLLVELYWS